MQNISRIIFNPARLIKSNLKQVLPRCRSTIELPPEIKAPQFTIPPEIVGQPTCHTHPHMIEPGHLTCGITQLEYRERRDTLMAKLAAEINNEHVTHVVVLPAARKQYMSDKIPYVFRQNSDFFYLTGCLEPSAVLVMVKPAQTDNYKTVLFVHEKDAHAELWEGPRTGCDAAEKLFTVDEARPVDNFNSFLRKVTDASKPSVLWYRDAPPANADLHAAVQAVLAPGAQVTLENPERAIHLMRVVKSPAEVELMKETCHVGAQSLNLAMACTKPGVTEHQINAVLEYSCKQAGAEHLAFPPVVAGGARAAHIHYIANNQRLAAGELLLVDTGCQRWYYNSDISRTWPVSGKFNKHQRILYELVLSVQKRLISLLGEHRPPLDQLFEQMLRLLAVALQQEGVLPRTLAGNELLSRVYKLCPHHVSHYLGVDVHDAPRVRRHVPVADGMLVTVEPGLYISPNDKSVPEEFRGIGIRIEDDILITSNSDGYLNLTSSCVKEVEDIEQIVGKQNL